jgi:hypothetical protein
MFTDIHPINYGAITEMEESLALKGYSGNTVKTYRNEFSQFLAALREHPFVGTRNRHSFHSRAFRA